MTVKLTAKELKFIADLVTKYQDNSEFFVGIHDAVKGYFQSSGKLKALAHSFKSRIKDPDHLKDKLIRQALEAKRDKIPFPITEANLFMEINDLVGFRIIHLHTKQVEEIDAELKRIFHENTLILVEGPEARTWDDEMRSYFSSIGMKIHKSPNPDMYTSVHYVVKLNTRSDVTCEIQVRTLMEEVWGEVSHTINYPHPTDSNSCREQIRVLARVTSSCSRLVDSIFNTHSESSKSSVKSSTKTKTSKSISKKAASKISKK